MRVYEGYVTKDGDYDSERIAAVLLRGIDARKKISRIMTNLSDVKYLVDLARLINSADEYSISVQDVRFDELSFPKCLDFLVQPAKVSINANPSAKDLLFHCSVDDVVYDPQKAIFITHQIYGSQRAGGEFTKIQDLREPKLLNDVHWMVYDGVQDWRTFKYDNFFRWNVPLNRHLIDVFGEMYFNESGLFDSYEFLARWGIDSQARQE